MNWVSVTFNYIICAVMVAAGVLALTGTPPFPSGNDPFTSVLGVIFILLGLLRLLLFRMKTKEKKRNQD